MNNFYYKLKDLQSEEKEAIIKKIKDVGSKVDSTYEYYFSKPYPVIAGYLNDTPTNLTVKGLLVRDNNLTIILDDSIQITSEDIFTGQLDILVDCL